MAHIGQKFALVLAGHFEVAGFFGQSVLRYQQFGRLALELPGLLFQKMVALFQLFLLGFHLCLRILQDAALLL